MLTLVCCGGLHLFVTGVGRESLELWDDQLLWSSASTWSPPAPCWCPDYCRWPTCSRCWTPGSHPACAIFLCSLDENLVGQLTGEHLVHIQLVHIHRTRSLLHSVHWPSGRALVNVDRWFWFLRKSILFAIEFSYLAFTGVLLRLDISSLRAELG